MVSNNVVVPIKLPIMWWVESSWGKHQFAIVVLVHNHGPLTIFWYFHYLIMIQAIMTEEYMCSAYNLHVVSNIYKFNIKMNSLCISFWRKT